MCIAVYAAFDYCISYLSMMHQHGQHIQCKAVLLQCSYTEDWQSDARLALCASSYSMSYND